MGRRVRAFPGSAQGPGEARRSFAGPGDPFTLGSSPGIPRPSDGETVAGPYLLPDILLPSSGGWKRELKRLGFCLALATGTGPECPAAPAHVLDTACPEAISPKLLAAGNHLSCLNIRELQNGFGWKVL